MSLEQLITIGAIKQFLEGTQAVAFSVATQKKSATAGYRAPW